MEDRSKIEDAFFAAVQPGVGAGKVLKLVMRRAHSENTDAIGLK